MGAAAGRSSQLFVLILANNADRQQEEKFESRPSFSLHSNKRKRGAERSLPLISLCQDEKLTLLSDRSGGGGGGLSVRSLGWPAE